MMVKPDRAGAPQRIRERMGAIWAQVFPGIAPGNPVLGRADSMRHACQRSADELVPVPAEAPANELGIGGNTNQWEAAPCHRRAQSLLHLRHEALLRFSILDAVDQYRAVEHRTESHDRIAAVDATRISGVS